jgi:hypothetical protein
LDFEKSRNYLIEKVGQTNSWLHNQLTSEDDDLTEEKKRKEIIIHRVVSYLVLEQIVEEFKQAYGLKKLDKYSDIKLESYHFAEELCIEMENLSAKLFKKKQDRPSNLLVMTKEDHAEILNTFNIEESDVSQEKRHFSFSDLRSEMCKRRELVFDKKKLSFKLNENKKIPLICCKVKKSEKSDLLSNYRKAVYAFRLGVGKVSGRKYLFNTFAAGEGSHLILSEQKPFVYALRCYYSKRSNTMSINDFAREWNGRLAKDYPQMRSRPYMRKLLRDLTAAGWPSTERISKSYPSDFEKKGWLSLKEIEGIVKEIEIAFNV